jgi:hypothetical protein
MKIKRERIKCERKEGIDIRNKHKHKERLREKGRGKREMKNDRYTKERKGLKRRERKEK